MDELSQAAVAPSVAPSPGAALRVAREIKGWTIEYVASQLKLSTGQIAALEADAFDRLPGNTFIRGFVRNYSRLLGMESEPLLAQLALLLPAERAQAALPRLPQEDGPSFTATAGGGGKPLLGIIAVLAGLLLGAVLVFWYLQQPARPELALAESSAPAVALVPVAASDLVASEIIPASAVAGRQASAASQVLAGSAAQVASEPVIVIKPASAPGSLGASVPLGHGDLQIAAQADSWVEVRDADGQKLYSGMLKPGADQVLGGKLPYTLTVGNAPNTRITFRGKQVDLASATRANVATIELK
ncbi:helix-turn-helix domain-containing protein [Chitinilyticum piscinae]|uniref:Helix-turn-helix domain-containing protein n=1 Tax=Chitinilyticum piscinae TaxID=2866724 RepID=A0A8J7FKT7_9NEIS|nr:helix-turn-helix domain-containing protein [Chitinilyticum piscinae]MBE9609597.1 helix-turn-helix domain-containing protein [Chitinilyticum piscinae]